jgi:hypothetical protein
VGELIFAKVGKFKAGGQEGKRARRKVLKKKKDKR